MNVRLLPKTEIDSKRAEEQRQRIQEGMRIAEKVDTLRETAASEEAAFEKYRTEMLQTIQGEIQEKTAERDILEALLKNLRPEFERLSNPPDLIEAREKIRIQKQKNKEEADRLFNLETFLEREKETIEERKQSLSEKEDAIEIARRNVEIRTSEVYNMREEAKLELDRSQKEAHALTLKAELLLTEVQEREDVVSNRENQVQFREEKNTVHEQELSKREARLADRMKMLERTLKRR